MAGLNDFLSNFEKPKDEASQDVVKEEIEDVKGDPQEDLLFNIKPKFKLEDDISLEKIDESVSENPEPDPPEEVELVEAPETNNASKEVYKDHKPSLGAIKNQGGSSNKLDASGKRKFEDYDAEELDYLFELSETSPRDKERWISTMKEAFASKKNNVIVRKLRSGRFRISEDEISILPQFNTKDMSANELLNQKW